MHDGVDEGRVSCEEGDEREESVSVGGKGSQAIVRGPALSSSQL